MKLFGFEPVQLSSYSIGDGIVRVGYKRYLSDTYAETFYTLKK
jgi:hypothetical protein